MRSETVGTGRSAVHITFSFKTKEKSSKRGTIYCTVSCELWRSNGGGSTGRLRQSTGISLESKYLLAKGGLSDKTPGVDKIREELDGIVHRIRQLERRRDISTLDSSREPIGIDQVRAAIDTRSAFKGDDTLLVSRSPESIEEDSFEYGGFIGRFLKEYVLVNGLLLKDSYRAYANMRTMALNLWRFSAEKYGGALRVQDLVTPSTATNIDRQLLHFLRHEVEPGLAESSIENVFKRLRTALKWGQRQGLIPDVPDKLFRIKASRTPKVVLSEEEFGQLLRYEFSSSEGRLSRVRDLFVFHCRTGLRFQDGQRVRVADTEQDFFRITTSKTRTLVTIPLDDSTRAILQRYEGRLPQMSNQKFNTYLKEVFEVVGLTRELETVQHRRGASESIRTRLCDVAASHMGRRFFVSWARKKGVPDAVIQEVTGHTNLDELDTYTHLSELDVVRAFQGVRAQSTI